ncbi:ArsR family transcriptional regulator [Pseudomonas sp. LFS044]|uniref:ArsR family transcriptional regulator n=1 Tax=Pseudomonas sp. LFS044 TaxID=3229880 RepID=UPI003A80E86F
MALPNRILKALQDNQSLGSRDIAEPLNASWPTVKHHLNVLLEQSSRTRLAVCLLGGR